MAKIMKERTMTNTEYLLRAVRESEHMPGWQDTFSKMREDITKSFERESFENEDIFEK